MTAPVVVARGLRKSYGDLTVLDGVDLDVGTGEVLALLGPNGAGKTTTVRILSTLLKPDGGTAYVAGKDVVRQPAQVRAAISLTGQFAAVDDLLTGIENLHLMARLAHLGRAEVRTRSAELLELFDLTDAGKRVVKTYSGGMRRRLDLAVGLLSRPQVVFLDEPTTGPRPAQPQRPVGRHPVRGRGGHDRAAHHAVPRGGRPAGRPRGRHRPRPRHRGRHRARAQAGGRLGARRAAAQGRHRGAHR